MTQSDTDQIAQARALVKADYVARNADSLPILLRHYATVSPNPLSEALIGLLNDAADAIEVLHKRPQTIVEATLVAKPEINVNIAPTREDGFGKHFDIQRENKKSAFKPEERLPHAELITVDLVLEVGGVEVECKESVLMHRSREGDSVGFAPVDKLTFQVSGASGSPIFIGYEPGRQKSPIFVIDQYKIKNIYDGDLVVWEA